jgi:predicted RNase H-like nuclease (RuvC/YqgF family)
MKQPTREQIQCRKDKAVRFVRDVLDDPERAEEIAEESLENYAARRKIQILNPTRRATMPGKTVDDYRVEVADLKDQISALEEKNESLQEQLDQIGDIVAGEEEEEDEGEDESGE